MTIKQQINLNGSNFMNSLIEIIHENATKPNPYNENIHEQNKQKLKRSIKKVCDIASLKNPITYDEFWYLAYTKIFYAGTKADKATKEIESIKQNGGFNNFRNLNDDSWDFEKSEWEAFSAYWKKELKSKGDWLKKAKMSNKWQIIIKHYFKKTGNNAINLMTKSQEYENIKFSSLAAKMSKYINLARKLVILEKDYKNVIEYFIGNDYNYEPEKFWQIHEKFAELLGDITSLHLMMDLGFKNVKPDRVLTYLFYKLGWLESIETNLSQEIIVKKEYLKKKVWIDVINKAILLEKVWNSEYSNSLRAIDLWIVKYGQEPEESFGITKNLQKEISIEKIYELVVTKIK